jgi:hypothetical protein
VVVGVVADDDPTLLEVGDDGRVGVEDVLADVVGDLGGEAPGVVDRADQDHAVGLAHPLVVLAEARRQVHHAGPVVVGDVVVAQHDERVPVPREVREHRVVVQAGQLGAREGAHHPVALAELPAVAVDGAGAQHDPPAGPCSVGHLDHGVGQAGPRRQAQVGRQRPRRRGPGPHLRGAVAEQLAGGAGAGGVELEGDGERRVLAGTGGVVETDLEVRQRGLGPPRVGHDAVGLVDEALVPQPLEGPDHGLHVGEVHGLVVVVEVDPAGLSGDVALPLVRVAQHRGAAVVVEAVDAVLGDGQATRDAGLLLDHHLRGKAVAVPAEAPVDPLAPHGLVAGDDVLDVAGQQVAVVGEPVGEGRAVVEDELVVERALLDGALEGVLLRPAVEQPPFQGGQVRARGHGGIGRCITRGCRIHDRSSVAGASRPSRSGFRPDPGPWLRVMRGFGSLELDVPPVQALAAAVGDDVARPEPHRTVLVLERPGQQMTGAAAVHAGDGLRRDDRLVAHDGSRT